MQSISSKISACLCNTVSLSLTSEIQSMEECGQQLKGILDSPSVPQANHQLLVHLTRHLCKVTQTGGAAQASPRLLALAYSEPIFKNNHFRYCKSFFVNLNIKSCKNF